MVGKGRDKVRYGKIRKDKERYGKLRMGRKWNEMKRGKGRVEEG